jgi:hypothetical protein
MTLEQIDSIRRIQAQIDNERDKIERARVQKRKDKGVRDRG